MALPTPSPVSGPLPGGREGAAVRVHPLRTADMLAMPAMYQRLKGPLSLPRALVTPKGRWFPVPIPAFLVEHPEAGPILVDAGMHADVATDVRGHLGRVAAMFYAITMEPSWAAPAQLRERGVEPADVRLIVMTHLHYDHASGLSQFPGATVLVDDREWEQARHGRFLEGYDAGLFPAALTWRTYTHAADEVDVLGDGSIRLLRTPGHTAGHRSVVLRLAEGRELLLTGDAAYAIRSLDERLLPWVAWDDDAYLASVDRLRAWRDAHPGATIIAGHDKDTGLGDQAVYA
ncbi:MAG: N-acyl homoserine lactonase family protein [Solirubrobacterales bacterium]|nr:N-acyl homoserine lactonase family protein [Solirubrobacterales bacterium]